MSVLSADEQELYNVAKASLPRWFFQDQGADEQVAALAKIMQLGRAQVQTWLDATYILRATGFWLDQHAKDRNLARQSGESDAALRLRIRSYADAVTAPAIAAAVNALLVQDGITDPCAIYESRRDQAYYSSGAGRAYFARGHRFGRTNHRAIIVILPIGASAGVVASVSAAVRVLAAGGVDTNVEIGTAGVAYQRISVTPPTRSAAHGGATVTFAAQIRVADTVTWKVNGVAGGNATVGTIAAGVYTPPAAVPFPEDVEVQAVGALDGTTGRARVKIT